MAIIFGKARAAALILALALPLSALAADRAFVTADSSCAEEIKPTPEQSSWYCRNVDATIDGSKEHAERYHPRLTTPGYRFCGYRFGRVFHRRARIAASGIDDTGVTLDLDAYRPDGKATTSFWVRGYIDGTATKIDPSICAKGGWKIKPGIVANSPDPEIGRPRVPRCVARYVLMCGPNPCGACSGPISTP